MKSELSNNKQIVKNAVFLYLRMFLTMGIGLFTSRAILAALGVEDFGIYNIVGGVVVIFSFITASLRNATERFVSYELGIKDFCRVKDIYNVCIECHIVILIILLIPFETIGLWIIHNQLIIPSYRNNVIDIVYQLSILTFIINIMQVPFQSAIISFERMNFYAYLSIIEVILKLLIVYLLYISPIDKLVMYSLLMTSVSFIVLLIYYLYCTYYLELDHFKICKETKYFKEIFKFSSYSMINGSASILSIQAGNIFMNMFCGVVVNAASGIANQVSNHIYAFVANVQSAFQPQIVKLYAARDYPSLKNLIIRSSLASYYLILLISVPILAELNYILNLWLVDVPEYTEIFCQLLIMYFLIDTIQAPLWMLIYGTGQIKTYTIWTSIFVFFNIPITWVFLKEGYPPYVFFISRLVMNILCSIFRIIYIKKIINMRICEYFKCIMARASLVSLFAITLLFVHYNYLTYVMHPLLCIIVILLTLFVFITFLGFNCCDRKLIINMVKTKLFKE